MREIAYIWNYRNWGGAQIYFFSIIPAAAHQYRISFAMPEGSSDQIIERASKLGAVNFLDSQVDLQEESGVFGRVSRLVSKLRADLRLVRQVRSFYDPTTVSLHIDMGFWMSFWVLYALTKRYRVFLTVHTPLARQNALRTAIWRMKGRVLSARSNFQVLASNRAAAAAVEPYIGRPAAVAYSGIDIAEIDNVIESGRGRDETRAAVGVSEDQILVVLVGQFIPRKGCEILLECLPAIEHRVPNISLRWITMNEPEPRLVDRVRKAEREHDFRLLQGSGVGGRRGVHELQRAADIYLLPSLQEGLPMALVEAMALGTASIATDVGAVTEAIEDGVSGLVIPPASAGPLIDAITKLANERPLRDRLGAEGRLKAIREFDNRIAARINLDAYEAADQQYE